MASILFISRHLDCAPLAIKLADEGHLVKVYVGGEAKYKENAFLGFKNPSRAQTWKNFKHHDLILSDMVGTGKTMETIREGGGIVLGGGVFNDNLELNRLYGEQVARHLTKADIPHTVELSNKAALLQYLKEIKRPVVIKPEGNKPTYLTLVSFTKNNEVLISEVEKSSEELTPCIVQDKVEGIEISTEGWFNGKEFVKPFNHTIEKKRLFEGDRGPNTGCMGNVVWVTSEDRIIQTALLPLKPLLEKVEYVGPIDVNCIVQKDKIYFLEYTTRFGYDAIQALWELLRISLFNFLFRIATQHTQTIPFRRGECGIAVRTVMHPFPSEDGVENLQGIEVIKVTKEAKRHVWLSDVVKENESFKLGGVDGVIGCVTARGDSLREARRRVYRTLENIVLTPEVVFRRDIGEDVERKIQQLTAWGWINRCQFIQ